jgi:hypothetical protein
VSSDDPQDERVIYRERLQGVYFDFRGKSIFTRYDRCEFVKCTLLIDHATEQLAFTACVFKDCNIDKLQPDEARGLYVMRSPAERTAGRIRDQAGPSSGRAEGEANEVTPNYPIAIPVLCGQAMPTGDQPRERQNDRL